MARKARPFSSLKLALVELQRKRIPRIAFLPCRWQMCESEDHSNPLLAISVQHETKQEAITMYHVFVLCRNLQATRLDVFMLLLNAAHFEASDLSHIAKLRASNPTPSAALQDVDHFFVLQIAGLELIATWPYLCRICMEPM